MLAACAGGRLPEPRLADFHLSPIVPLPVSVERRPGELRLGELTAIVIPADAGADLHAATDTWSRAAAPVVGRALPIRVDDVAGAAIRLRRDGRASSNPEGYRLTVTTNGVDIRAPTDAGLFYGLQTLRQLFPVRVNGTRVLPAVAIEDAPRFRYRGMHLDVGRHFMPLEFIKKYIDLMALYKLNTFHWHLTEDQGWRLQIMRYPRLTEVGGCRKETVVAKNFNPFVGDGTPHCGFYTQEQAREIVQYARERFITVIPEIEMPGHSLAALAAYPELACTPGLFEVGARWGVFEDVLCPKKETLAFLEHVLDEVTRIFPGTYVHIGGDEVSKKRWQDSPIAQDIICREGLKDEHELQSWFIRSIESMLHARGRRLIGWDEILEGGLAPDATVMSWRGTQGGIAAARQGHDVIMTPNSHLYFDHYQAALEGEPLAIGGFSPLEKVYAFEPVPAELSSREARHILGAQANVWTEYMKTPEHVEYMVFPRMLALAEVVWSPRELRDWGHFQARLPSQLERLGALGVRYRPWR